MITTLTTTGHVLGSVIPERRNVKRTSYCSSITAMARNTWRPSTGINIVIMVIIVLLVVVKNYVRTTSPVSPNADYDNASRLILPLKTEPTQRRRQIIFYNRLPKCGSTTIFNMIKRLGGINNFTHVHSKVRLTFNINETKQRELCTYLTNLDAPAIFDRHVHFVNFARFQMETPMYMNIIRDPFERMVSWYYFRRYTAKLIKRLPDEDHNRSFDTCVLENHAECTEPHGNITGFGYFHLIPFFCGHEDFCQTPSKVALARAIANVDRYYKIVGVVEQFDQFIEALEYVFPNYFRGVWHMYTALGQPKKNRNVTLKKVTPTEKVKKIMMSKMGLEYQFYYYVKKRFDKLYRKIKSNDSRHAQGTARMKQVEQ